MKGFPKTFNTKKDVELCLEKWPRQTKAFLQRILDNRFEWLIDRKLDSTEEGVENDTHKVSVVYDEDGSMVERYQLEWKEDPNARLFRLGFTVDEAQELVK
jgi:hypothetical protein